MTENRGSATLFFRSRNKLLFISTAAFLICLFHALVLNFFPDCRSVVTGGIWFFSSAAAVYCSLSAGFALKGILKKAWTFISLSSFMILCGIIVRLYYNAALSLQTTSSLSALFFSAAMLLIIPALYYLTAPERPTFDIFRKINLLGIFLITLISCAGLFNYFIQTADIEFVKKVISMTNANSPLIAFLTGLSLYLANSAERVPKRHAVPLLLLLVTLLTFILNFRFYYPEIHSGNPITDDFSDVIYTAAIMLITAAASAELGLSDKKNTEKKDTRPAVLLREKILPGLCLLIFTISIFLNKNTISTPAADLLFISGIILSLLFISFEYSNYKSEHSLLSIVSGSPAGILITDGNMQTIHYVNRSLKEIFRIKDPHASLIPDSIVNMESQKNLLQLISARIVTSEAEDRFTRENGEQFTAIYRIIPARYYFNDLIIFWIKDITRFKEYETMILRQRDAALLLGRQKTDLLENLSSRILSGYILGSYIETEKGPDFILTDINSKALKILEISKDKGEGKILSELFTPASPVIKDNSINVFRSGESKNFEFYSKSLKKLLQLTLFKTGEEEIVCLINDITTDRKTRKKLEDRERELRVLMSNLPGMVYRCMNDKDWTMMFVSQGAYNLSGFMPEEIIMNRTVSWGDLIHPDDKDMVTREVERNLIEKTVFHIQYRIKTRDGETRYVWEKGMGIYDNTESLLFLEGFIMDVTPQIESEIALRISEDRLRKTEKAEAIAGMAGRITHDLNNQLMAINSYASLIDIKSGSPDISRYIKGIREIVSKSSDIVENLLAFTREKEIMPEPLSVHSMLQELTADIKIISKPEIKTELFLSAEKDITYGDPSQLQDAFLKIMNNSLESMNKGGNLTIATENMTISELPLSVREEANEGIYILVRLADTGRGIAPENMERIFDPFFTTKTAGDGKGMGLPAAFGTIRSHKGFIAAESRVGEGTVFTVYLPVSDNSSLLQQPE